VDKNNYNYDDYEEHEMIHIDSEEKDNHIITIHVDRTQVQLLLEWLVRSTAVHIRKRFRKFRERKKVVDEE